MQFCATTLLLIPLALFAQEPKPAPSPSKPVSPPAEVDQALRGRATAFLQYQMDGNFRKAYDLVAEDSKDYYFSIEKGKILSFKIDEITYAEDFSKATVRATTSRETFIAGQRIELPTLVSDQWKLDDGKWTWYHDPKLDSVLTFFGSLPAGGGSQATAEPVDPKFLPKNTSPEAVAAAAANLIQPTSIDKTSITFTEGKSQTEEVTFHNGNPGQIEVSAWVMGSPDGITVEPVKTLVGARADLKLKIHYTPGQTTPHSANIRFEVQPFDTGYVMPVTITPEAATPKP